MDKAKSDGHCCLVMGKACGCCSWVKAKSQPPRPQLQTLGCREVSSEEVKGRQGTFWRHRVALLPSGMSRGDEAKLQTIHKEFPKVDAVLLVQ